MAGDVADNGSRGPLDLGEVYTGPNVQAPAGSSLSLYCDRCAQGLEPEHVHSQLQLSVVFDPGICDYTWRDASGKTHLEHVVGPQFLIIAPNVVHSCRWHTAADVVILYIEAPLREALLPHGTEAFVTSNSVAGATQDLVVWQLAATLGRIYNERATPDTQLLHGVAMTVAQRALKVFDGALPLGVPGAPKLSEDRLQLLTNYIYANLAGNLRVSDLAKKVGLSEPHLTALFTAATHLSPYKFITRCRMLKAYEMLKTGAHRVAEVALAVGIPDQAYFSSRFHDYFQFTPRSVLLQTRLEPAESPNKP
jgi:AraC-like DNA-binding protein